MKALNRQVKRKQESSDEDERTAPAKATGDIEEVMYRTVLPH
jgi:hypothetical protein